MIRLHHDFDPTRFIAPTIQTPDLYTGFLEVQRQRSDATVLVAEEGALVVGYAYATLEGNDFLALRGPAGVIHDLVVDPIHRRKGIERLLVEAMRDELHKRGAPRIVLSPAAKNEPAQQLFATVGFRSTMIEMTVDLSRGEG